MLANKSSIWEYSKTTHHSESTSNHFTNSFSTEQIIYLLLQSTHFHFNLDIFHFKEFTNSFWELTSSFVTRWVVFFSFKLEASSFVVSGSVYIRYHTSLSAWL